MGDRSLNESRYSYKKRFAAFADAGKKSSLLHFFPRPLSLSLSRFSFLSLFGPRFPIVHKPVKNDLITGERSNTQLWSMWRWFSLILYWSCPWCLPPFTSINVYTTTKRGHFNFINSPRLPISPFSLSLSLYIYIYIYIPGVFIKSCYLLDGS